MRFYFWMLKKIARRCTIQGTHHDRLVTAFRYFIEEARRTFTEDNKPTLDSFISDCLQEALDYGSLEHLAKIEGFTLLELPKPHEHVDALLDSTELIAIPLRSKCIAIRSTYIGYKAPLALAISLVRNNMEFNEDTFLEQQKLMVKWSRLSELNPGVTVL
jgi:hypothetical protein